MTFSMVMVVFLCDLMVRKKGGYILLYGCLRYLNKVFFYEL